MTDAFENPSSLSVQVTAAEKGIRAGFIAALISLGITLLITILGATGSIDFDNSLGGPIDWYMLIDVAIIAACAIGLWFKSRTAATIMFLYFLLSKILLLVAGQFSGSIMGLVFLYFYGRAMICSYRYHDLVKKGANATDVF